MNHNNLTTFSTPYIRWQHWNWIVPETVNSIFILLTLWICFSLIYYGNNSKKWVTRKERNFEKLNAGFILMAAVLCAVMTLLRFIASQLVFNIGFSDREDIECKIVFNASTVVFFLAVFSVHIFLWIRQLVFYKNRMLNTEFSKTLRLFSYFSIIIISLGKLLAILVSTIPTKFKSTLKGCVYIPIDSNSPRYIIIVNLLILLFGETTLVGLLIYPLHKHSQRKGCLALCGLINCPLQREDQQNALQTNKNQDTTHRSGTNKKINIILRRTVCYFIIIVVSNVVTLTVAFYASLNTLILIMLCDVITFANLAFVVSSIGGWKKIVCLTPPT